MIGNSTRIEKVGGPAMVILGAVFIATSQVALGAAFLAIGAALISKQKKTDDAG